GNMALKNFPVFEPKDKVVVFKKKFAIPLVNKPGEGEYTARTAPPALGMRRQAIYIPKPLHDPAGEFAIVLYDPTIDDIVPPPAAEQEEAAKVEAVPEAAEEPPKNEPESLLKRGKSIAQILGLDA